MLETVMKHGIIFYVIGILMAVGVLAKLISYITARKLVKAASDIQKSNQRLMRLVKAKFEHASMVSDKVQNVEAFVGKYLYEYKVFGVRLSSWQSFPLKMIWLIVTFGLLGTVMSYRAAGLEEQTLHYGAFAAIYAVVLVSIHILSDEKTKLDAAKNYMVEYLENVCVHRYEKVSLALHAAREENTVENDKEEMTESALEGVAEAVTEVKAEPVMENKVKKNAVIAEEAEKSQSPLAEELEERKRRDEQEMRIRAILEEFLA